MGPWVRDCLQKRYWSSYFCAINAESNWHLRETHSHVNITCIKRRKHEFLACFIPLICKYQVVCAAIKTRNLTKKTLILEQINVEIKILLRNEFLNMEIRYPIFGKILFFYDFLSKTILIGVKNFEIYP